ncbi:uncharacterized protein METZ01_LOCUS106259 [marine metagenome]|uniref:Uncharacterized protein n=1 Tax=marine metagenome TaxID=408172 RepID=A0A381WLQ1_9ZZZZ
MTISARGQYLKDNPHIQQIIQPVALAGDHLMGVGPKTDGGFNENMSRIADAHPNSPLADRYGSGKTNAQIKARNVINKYK